MPRVNFYEGLKNGNLASSIVHLTDNLDLIPGTFDLMLLPKLTRSWTFENESRLLATLLAPLKSDYDLIIIDASYALVLLYCSVHYKCKIGRASCRERV